MNSFKLLFLSLLLTVNVFAQQADSAKATITPNEVIVGQQAKEFQYTIKMFGGTADSISIVNPFEGHKIIVSSIKIDGNSIFLSNQLPRPTEPGYASWNYNDSENVLVISSDTSAITDSIVVLFNQNIPNTTSSNNSYSSIFDDLKDPTEKESIIENNWKVSVIADAISQIRIEDKQDGSGLIITDSTITADDTLSLYAIGRDKYDNFVNSVEGNWSVTNEIGTVNPTNASSQTIFYASKVGAGTIKLVYQSFTDQTGIINVKLGVLNRLQIRNGTNGGGTEVGDISLTTDQTLLMYAAGYDSDDNYIGDIAVDWTSSGTLDQITGDQSSFSFAPTTAPTSGEITITKSGVTTDKTGTISVNVGALDNITIVNALGNSGIAIDSLTLTTDSDYIFYLAGYDQDKNFIRNINSKWSIQGEIGTLSTGDSYSTSTVLTATTIGSGIIQADTASFTDQTGIINIKLGNLNYIKIRNGTNGGGSEVANLNLSTDESILLFAAGYDEDSNFISNVDVSWKSTGTLDPINVNADTIEFSPNVAPSSGKIYVEKQNIIGDSTGIITVLPGELNFVRIEDSDDGTGSIIGEIELTVDDTIQMFASGYDKDGNFLRLVNATWSRTGSLDDPGDPGTSIIFRPTTAPSSGTILSDSASITGHETGLVTVKVGKLDSIIVLDAPGGVGQIYNNLFLTTDDSIRFYSAGYDKGLNYIGDVNTIWSVIGGIGTISTNLNYSDSTTFIAKYPGVGKVKADSATFNFETASITVTKGIISKVKILSGPNGNGIEVADSTITADQSIILYAAGYDSDENYVGDISINWGMTGTLSLDDLSHTNGPSIIYSPVLSERNGKIFIYAEALNKSDTTGIFNILDGAVANIEIMNDSGENADSVQSITMTADDKIGLFIAGFDSDDNFVSNVSGTWALSENIGSFSNLTGSNTTFDAKTIGNSIITAKDGEMVDEVIVKVLGGAINYLVIHDPASKIVENVTLTTDSSFVLMTGSYDSDNNYLGDTTVTWGVTNELTQSDLSALMGVQTLFSPTNSGASGYLTATFNSSIKDSTGLIEVINPPIISYVASSLKPNTVSSTSKPSFEINLNNIGDVSVTLDTTTFITFTDGLSTFKSQLKENVDLDKLTNNVKASFKIKSIPDALSPGLYTPLIYAYGTDVRTNPFKQENISIDFNGLNLSKISIIDIFSPDTIVWQGKKGISLSLTVKNESGSVASNLTGSFSFNNNKSEYSLNRTDKITDLQTGEEGVLKFTVSIDNNATPGEVKIVGNISAKINELELFEVDTSVYHQWTLLSLPNLSYVDSSIIPQSVTKGQNVEFVVTVFNQGSMGLTLNNNSNITLSTGSDSIGMNIIDEKIVIGNSKTDLRFVSSLIPNSLSYRYYYPRLELMGMKDNNELYSSIISISSDSIQIDSPVELSIVQGTLLPDTVAHNQDVSFSVEVKNKGSADAIIDESKSWIKINDGPLQYKSVLTGNSLISGLSQKRVSFIGTKIDSQFSLTFYKASFQMEGLDHNGFSFISVDSTNDEYLAVITPPKIVYSSGLTPTVIKPGEEIAFELLVNNKGQAPLMLDTNTTLQFSYGNKTYTSNLSQSVYLQGEMENKVLKFHRKMVTNSGRFGKFPIYLDLNGHYLRNVPFTQNNLFTDSVYVWSGRGAEIASISYIDGSINGVPDGIINGNDLIKIKFDREIHPINSQNVSNVFTLISEGDRFSQDETALIKNPDDFDYVGIDEDSVTFIELGNEPIIANSGASNRNVNNPNSLTIIRAEYNPSLIIINTNIDEGVIVGVDGSDAGFPMNKTNLDSQLFEINLPGQDYQKFSRFSILALDDIQPAVLNVYPNWDIEKNISAYTPFKAFISGRNFVYEEDLVSFITELFSNNDSIEYYVNDYLKLYSKVNSMIFDNPEGVLSLRTKLDSYDIMSSNKTSSILINPFKRMFMPVLDPIRYNFTNNMVEPDTFIAGDNASIEFDRTVEDYAIEADFIPKYNLTIESTSDFSNKTYAWLNFETATKSYSYVDSFSVSNERGMRSLDGYFVWSAPNPFIKKSNNKIEIEYELIKDVNIIELILIDSAGRLVKKWDNKLLNSTKGIHRVNNGWDGSDMNGDNISAGVYLLYLKIENTLKSSWIIAYQG